MALVNHEIPAGKGNFYLYEHFRVPGEKNPRTRYVGRSNVRVVSNIPSKGYPVEATCYKEGHQAGIQAEKKKYGEERYQELNQHIKEVIPEGELAGSHTKDGTILVHKNIDPKYHKQIITHEEAEHKYMEKEQCKI